MLGQYLARRVKAGKRLDCREAQSRPSGAADSYTAIVSSTRAVRSRLDAPFRSHDLADWLVCCAVTQVAVAPAELAERSRGVELLWKLKSYSTGGGGGGGGGGGTSLGGGHQWPWRARGEVTEARSWSGGASSGAGGAAGGDGGADAVGGGASLDAGGAAGGLGGTVVAAAGWWEESLAAAARLELRLAAGCRRQIEEQELERPWVCGFIGLVLQRWGRIRRIRVSPPVSPTLMLMCRSVSTTRPALRSQLESRPRERRGNPRRAKTRRSRVPQLCAAVAGKHKPA